MPVAHAYRVTLRVAKKYRVRDGDLIEAAFLHDTGEDYAQELAEMYNATSGAPLLPNREGALAFIDNHFGGITAFTVGALSHEPNGPDDSEETKIQNYGEYIAGLAHSPRALIIKTADIFDNVTNPSPNPKQKYYSMKKYLFAIEPLMRGIERNATTLNAMSREWDPASGEPEKLSDALLRDLRNAKMVAVALLARPIPA
jgi:hypothetical protein